MSTATTYLSTNSSTPQSTIQAPDKQQDSLEQEDLGIVIIGAGMAGSRLAIQLATELNKLPTDVKRPKITLISKEKQVGYNRIMLSPVLAGETPFADTYLYDKSDYQRLNIQVMAGVSVTAIHSKQQRIHLNNAQSIGYSKLVLATGSTARVLPFPNHDAKGVHVFRDVNDVTMLSEYAKQGKTGLVIGGGVLGLEAACALQSQGANMTVIHVDDFVLNRQLDLPAATLLQGELARRGVGLELSAMSSTIEINNVGEVTGLSLKDGRTIAADFIVMAVGIIPNTQLASDSGIDVNRGIMVDEYMHTNCDNIYAIGECVELAGELFGMVSSVNQHVDTLVSVLVSIFETSFKSLDKSSSDSRIESRFDTTKDTALANKGLQASDKQSWIPFISQPLVLKLKVSGIAVFSAGQVAFSDSERESLETIVYQQTGEAHYQCLYIKNNRLIGAVLYGDVDEGGFYSQLINEQTDISLIKDNLIYGAAYCDLTEPQQVA